MGIFFKIRSHRVISGNKWQNSFCLLCFVTKSLCSVGEVNFSQVFVNERRGIISLFAQNSRLYLSNFSLSELVRKRRNASPLIKVSFVLKFWVYGWQDEMCVY